MATFCKIEKFVSICLEFQVLFNVCLFQLSLFPKFLLFASTGTNDISRPFFTRPSWTSCPSSNLACDLQQIFFQNFSITFKILVSLSALFELLDVGAKVTSNTLFMQFIYLYPGCKLNFGFFHFLYLKVTHYPFMLGMHSSVGKTLRLSQTFFYLSQPSHHLPAFLMA